MFFVGFITVLIAVAVGLGVKYLLDYNKSEKEITWLEYGIGSAVIVVLIVPLVSYIGFNVAKSNNLTFHEYWNGWEIEAQAQVIPCSKDGPCRHEYDCEPYIVMEACGETCVGEGSSRSCTTNYCPVTHYHDCPYVAQETTYVIKTTIGDYTIAEHRLPDDPDNNRWRGTSDFQRSIPPNVKNYAGIGAPEFWRAAKYRIDNNNPGPVTKRANYKNYILASDRTILKQYSGDIEEFIKNGLLPKPSTTVGNFYYADKVYFVGFDPPNKYDWQVSLAHLNAALGMELQGDLHLVIVQDQGISGNPDRYLFALKAYWQNRLVFKEDAVSKNTILVVVGTDDSKTVAWSRAITGMPMGNEYLLTTFRNGLNGLPLTPWTIIGGTKGELVWGDAGRYVQSHHNAGD